MPDRSLRKDREMPGNETPEEQLMIARASACRRVAVRQDQGMNRFLFLLLGFALVCRLPAIADGAETPFTMAKSYSAEMEITTAGTTMKDKVFADDGKMRTEMDAQGMQMVSIIRPDEQKIYSVMPAQNTEQQGILRIRKVGKNGVKHNGREAVGPWMIPPFRTS